MSLNKILRIKVFRRQSMNKKNVSWKYHNLLEKRLRLKDIFNAYSKISTELFELENDGLLLVHGDFGASDNANSPIFINSYYGGIDKEDEQYFFDSYLDLIENEDFVGITLSHFKTPRHLKLAYSILRRCKYTNLSYNKDEGELSIKLPATPSSEELDDIRDAFDELFYSYGDIVDDER